MSHKWGWWCSPPGKATSPASWASFPTNSDSPCEVSGHVTCTLEATLSFCHDDHWHRIFQKRWLNNFRKIYSEYSFIVKGLPVCSISWGTGKRTRELSWKQSQSLIMWKRFVMWRSSWKPQKAVLQQIILETSFTTRKMFDSLTFIVIFVGNLKYRFVGRWTTWTSRTRRKRTLGFLAYSRLAALFHNWRWPTHETTLNTFRWRN